MSTVNESLGSLKALGSPTNYWDHIIIYIIVYRFDTETREAWEMYQGASVELSQKQYVTVDLPTIVIDCNTAFAVHCVSRPYYSISNGHQFETVEAVLPMNELHQNFALINLCAKFYYNRSKRSVAIEVTRSFKKRTFFYTIPK